MIVIAIRIPSYQKSYLIVFDVSGQTCFCFLFIEVLRLESYTSVWLDSYGCVA